MVEITFLQRWNALLAWFPTEGYRYSLFVLSQLVNDRISCTRWSREDQDGKSSRVWLVNPRSRDGRDHLSPTMRQPSKSTRMRSKLGLWSGYPLVCLTYSIMHPFRSVDHRKKSKLSFRELSTFSVGTWSISNKKYNKHVEAFTSTIAH